MENELLRRLLGVDFEGAHALRAQLANLRVRPIDRDGSLRLIPVDPVPARVSRRIPIEAVYADADRAPVHVLIHVVDGLLDELEVYREDGGNVLVMPSAASKLEPEPWVVE